MNSANFGLSANFSETVDDILDLESDQALGSGSASEPPALLDSGAYSGIAVETSGDTFSAVSIDVDLGGGASGDSSGDGASAGEFAPIADLGAGGDSSVAPPAFAPAGPPAAPGPAVSLQTLANYLTTGFWSEAEARPGRFYNVDDNGAGANFGNLYYNISGFSSSLPTIYGSESADADGISAARATMVREAFKIYGQVLGINFIETTSTATHVDFFFSDNKSGAYAASQMVAGNGGAIDYTVINVNSGWNGGTSTIGDYTFQTFLHEIGHALGLGHQGNYNGSGGFLGDAKYENDSWALSMMSYFDQVENSSTSTTNYDYARLISPMSVDWIALNDLYDGQDYVGRSFGVNQAFTGDTVWGFNTNISSATSAALNSIASLADTNAFTIVDGGGNDTVDFSGFAADQRINLQLADPNSTLGSVSNVGGLIGNMTIAVGSIIENAVGGSGNDSIIGNEYNNVLTGNAGNDTLKGYGGSDTLYGGAGNDNVYGDEGIGGADIGDTLYGGNDDDGVYGGLGDDTLYGDSGVDNLYGGAGSDTLDGGLFEDNSYGGAGNDFFNISGNVFADNVYGGTESDTLNLSGWTNAGFSFNVNLAAQTYNLVPDFGPDYNYVIQDVENVYGSDFNDTITGDANANVLKGLGGNDVLVGGGGVDTLLGLDGNDTITDSGDNTVDGGTGDDTIINTFVIGGTWDGGDGVDTIDLSQDNYNANIDLSGVSFVNFGATFSNFENATGTQGNDTITGKDGTFNILKGGLGNDTIIDNDGSDDNLDGGVGGLDTLVSDLTYVEDATFNMLTGIGTFFGGTFVHLANFENITVGGGADIVGDNGNNFLTALDDVQSGFNIIEGNGGVDVITTGAGNDTLYGGTGNDQLYAGADSDYVNGGTGDDRIDGGAGVDLIDYTAAGSALYIDLRVATQTATGGLGTDVITLIENVNGGAFADTLIGNAGINTLYGFSGTDSLVLLEGDDFGYGGAGDDYLAGRDGNDSLFGDDNNDVIDGGNGIDTLRGNAGDDYIIGGADNDTIYGGDGAGNVGDIGDRWLGGDGGNDTIFGNLGTDRLSGGAGNDFLTGGEGFDYMTGEAGIDTFIYNALSEGSISEQIGDWQGGVDKLQIDASAFGGGLAAGALAANRLVNGTVANQAFGQFLYNSGNGVVYWDADGTGAGAAVAFTRLFTTAFTLPPASLAATDFLLVA